MRASLIGLCVAGLIGTAGALPAQNRSRHFEFGAFGAYTRYDRAFGLDDVFGGGARFGYFLTPHLGLEADVLFQSAVTVPGSSSSFEPMLGGGSLLVNLPVGDFGMLYVLGGYSRLDFGTVSPYRFTDGAAHAGAGVRISLGSRAALRFEARGLYTPETNGAFGRKSVRHLVASAGFTVFHSTRPPAPPRDSDSDGVTDGADACPGTPTGAAVDRKGCPLDGDSDGVYDGLDRCPDTPAGARVDAGGCHTDSDGDAVLDGLDQCPDTPRGATVDAQGCPADSDGDRVYDGIDQCPGTPPGATVNALGCTADQDADRVPDGVDQCPDTPPGALVDAQGCPTDSDGDRVYDGIDQCPGTPAGAAVNERGCPAEVIQAERDTLPRDTDGDGVPDGTDRCPATPAGAPVDQAGCLILFREAPGTEAKPLVLRGVNFASGRSILTRESLAVLDEVAASLRANPDVRIEIAGHTDASGSEGLNLRLSEARAAAVRHYLANRGVSPDRMVARGYGESQPVASNDTPEGKAQNRRVELRRIP